jgi:hypothetical protein
MRGEGQAQQSLSITRCHFDVTQCHDRTVPKLSRVGVPSCSRSDSSTSKPSGMAAIERTERSARLSNVGRMATVAEAIEAARGDGTKAQRAGHSREYMASNLALSAVESGKNRGVSDRKASGRQGVGRPHISNMASSLCSNPTE